MVVAQLSNTGLPAASVGSCAWIRLEPHARTMCGSEMLAPEPPAGYLAERMLTCSCCALPLATSALPVTSK